MMATDALVTVASIFLICFPLNLKFELKTWEFRNSLNVTSILANPLT